MIKTFTQFENFKYDKFQPLNPWEQTFDFYKDSNFSNLFYNNNITEKDIKKFKSFLNSHKEHYVLLYHGTDSNIPISEQGLKKTTQVTKKSLQSTPGFVYLSVFPTMAKTFAKLAYPYAKNITVYQVYLKIKDLKPDMDQIKNKNLYSGSNIGNSLAESLIFGHGCRIAKNIEPYQIKIFDI